MLYPLLQMYVVNPLPDSDAEENNIYNYQILSSSIAISTGISGIPVSYDANDNLISTIVPDVGAFEYNNTLSIQTESKKSFFIYPNPTDNKLTIRTKLGLGIVSVFDINGRLLASKKFSNQQLLEYQFDISNLSNGIYLLEVQLVNSKRVIKFIRN